ncbi:ureidoglycolate hydrolase [Skermanella stibiiresistens SB22]|uniref:Ureidoglycolate hydrolase n=1 Tax=Skermanella stibiiresistens SB22 TaxID=1385369 RepID=W9HDW4_9PROT|nr:ureidoglycolate lyase [Skermanella stibiiresistens]EWY42088.1 ureidoglycolate hydrolase [Skermanella stibiiresistens SB22]
MTGLHLGPQPLTAEAFAPFGEVVAAGAGSVARVNDGRADRFDGVGRLRLDACGTTPVVAIYRIDASALPHRVPVLERHPLSSQLFVPMTASRYLVVAVPSDADGAPVSERAVALVASGAQAINYRPGVWHCPLVALDQTADFAMVMAQASEPAADCEFFDLPVPLTVGPTP